MENLVWGARDSQGKVTSMKLHLGDPEGEVIATFVYDTSASPDVQFATLEGDSPEKIDLVFNGKGGAKADRPNGASFSAHPNKQRFSRSDEIMLDLGQRSLRMVNEAKSDWVIEDQDGTKLGQFSGANHGVRHVIVEMESDAELTPVEAAFVAWIARLTLEEKLVSTTWVLTMTLAAMTPFIIWYFFI